MRTTSTDSRTDLIENLILSLGSATNRRNLKKSVKLFESVPENSENYYEVSLRLVSTLIYLDKDRAFSILDKLHNNKHAMSLYGALIEFEFANYFHSRHRLSKALVHVQAAIEIAKSEHDYKHSCVCNSLRGRLLYIMGKHKEAEKVIVNALDDAKKLDDLGWQAVNMTTLGHIYFRSGDYSRSKAMLEESIIAHQETGNLMMTIASQNFLAEVLIDESKLDEAEAIAKVAFNIAREANMPNAIGGSLLVLSRLHIEGEKFRDAESALDRAESIYISLPSELGLRNAAELKAMLGERTKNWELCVSCYTNVISKDAKSNLLKYSIENSNFDKLLNAIKQLSSSQTLNIVECTLQQLRKIVLNYDGDDYHNELNALTSNVEACISVLGNEKFKAN